MRTRHLNFQLSLGAVCIFGDLSALTVYPDTSPLSSNPTGVQLMPAPLCVYVCSGKDLLHLSKSVIGKESPVLTGGFYSNLLFCSFRA